MQTSLEAQFLKFTILSGREDLQGMEEVTEDILFNINQIVSIKPINIVVAGEVIKGYWLRTTTGKKYRAISIPAELAALCQESSFTTEKEYPQNSLPLS